MKRRKRSYPLPEAIYTPRSGKWSIDEDLNARVDIKGGAFFAPLSNDPHSAVLRAHELAHVAFSPIACKVPKGTTMATLQGVENARVNTLAVRAGVDTSAGAPPDLFDAITTMALMSEHPRSLVALLLTCFTADERTKVIDRAAARNPELAEYCDNLSSDALRLLKAGPRRRYGRSSYRAIPFSKTVKVSQWLEAQFSKPTAPGQDNDQDAKAEIKTDRVTGAELGKSLSPLWGKLIIEYPDLRKPKVTRGVRVSDEGCVLRAPWRVTSDHKVFRACLRAPRRGTVLIDASGSMGLTSDQVKELAAKVPAGIVAAYGGREKDGSLRILAKHGKLADDTQYNFPGGNVIDGPCLAWLGRQYGPRLWISDGSVTGQYDAGHRELNVERDLLLKRHQIRRVRYTADAIKLLK